MNSEVAGVAGGGKEEDTDAELVPQRLRRSKADREMSVGRGGEGKRG